MTDPNKVLYELRLFAQNAQAVCDTSHNYLKQSN